MWKKSSKQALKGTLYEYQILVFLIVVVAVIFFPHYSQYVIGTMILFAILLWIWRFILFLRGYIAYCFQVKYLLGFSLSVEKRKFAPGEKVRFKIKLKPSNDVEIESLVAVVNCVETSESFGLKISQCYASYKTELEGKCWLKKGKPHVREGEILLPPDIDASLLRGSGNRWSLYARIGFPSGDKLAVRKSLKLKGSV